MRSETRHEARQVPSWLIFDVGHAKKMSVFKVSNGPVVDYSASEAGFYEATLATEANLSECVGYYVCITNNTDKKLWIENVFFQISSFPTESGLFPLYPNRVQSFPMKLPVKLLGRHAAVEYAVPLSSIPAKIADARGIVIRYRSYLLPIPVYDDFAFSDSSFALFTKAIRAKA